VARVILIILLTLNGILLVPGALLPMGQVMTYAFLTDIHLTNATTQPIQVTPIGVRESGGRRPLPIYASKYLSMWPESPAADFPITPGQTLTLTYDMDDILFSELVVVFPDGSVGQLVTNASASWSNYRPPATNRWTITGPGQLTAVSAEVEQALVIARKDRPMGLITAAIYAPWLTFALLLWWYRRLRRKPPPLPGAISQ
jgi:hypothetical protein